MTFMHMKKKVFITNILFGSLILTSLGTSKSEAVVNCRFQCNKISQKDQKLLNSCAQQCGKNLDIAKQLINRSSELSDKGHSSLLITLRAEQRKAQDSQKNIEEKLKEETSKREKNRNQSKIRDLMKQQDQIIEQANTVALLIKKLTPPLPQKAPEAPLAQEHNNWVPKEMDLIRGGDLFMELKKKNNNQNPNKSEAIKYLQGEMKLTEHQAITILEELGILELLKS